VNKKYLETIKVLDGKFYHLEYHQQRVDASLELESFYTLQTLLINPPKEGLYRCRIVYDINSFELEYIPYKKRNIQSLKLVHKNEIKYEKKYENRDTLNKLFLEKGTCDDILIIKNGLLTDTSIANIALFDGSHWVTPKEPLLYGTTRARLLQARRIEEKEIRVEDIKQYKKIALMNAMIDFDIIAVENIGEIIC